MTCNQGCSFSLGSGQSQYVGIRFAPTPCDVDSAATVHFDVNIYAGNAQAYAEGTGINPEGVECEL